MSSSGEDMVSCPYNSLHQVLRKHLQKHLLKCRLSHTDAELRKCPFNTSHLIPDEEYEMHLRSCPDKSFISKYKYDTSVPTRFEPIPKQQIVDDKDEENWDDEEYETYKPEKYAASAPIIRSNIGNLPSQRKEFRKNERRRHGEQLSDEDD